MLENVCLSTFFQYHITHLDVISNLISLAFHTLKPSLTSVVRQCGQQPWASHLHCLPDTTMSITPALFTCHNHELYTCIVYLSQPWALHLHCLPFRNMFPDNLITAAYEGVSYDCFLDLAVNCLNGTFKGTTLRSSRVNTQTLQRFYQIHI